MADFLRNQELKDLEDYRAEQDDDFVADPGTSHTVQELALRLELLSCNGPDKFLEAYPRPWASDASPDEKDEASNAKDEASGASPRKKRKESPALFHCQVWMTSPIQRSQPATLTMLGGWRTGRR